MQIQVMKGTTRYINVLDYIQINYLPALCRKLNIILPVIFISTVVEIVYNILPSIAGQNCANFKSSMTAKLS